MMHSRAYSPERVSFCAIAAALVLSVLLSGPAAGMTQRHCPTNPTPVDTMGATGEGASKCWCAESTCHVSRVKVWEQGDAYVIGMKSASNSAAQARRQLIPTGYRSRKSPGATNRGNCEWQPIPKER